VAEARAVGRAVAETTTILAVATVGTEEEMPILAVMIPHLVVVVLATTMATVIPEEITTIEAKIMVMVTEKGQSMEEEKATVTTLTTPWPTLTLPSARATARTGSGTWPSRAPVPRVSTVAIARPPKISWTSDRWSAPKTEGRRAP